MCDSCYMITVKDSCVITVKDSCVITVRRVILKIYTVTVVW